MIRLLLATGVLAFGCSLPTLPGTSDNFVLTNVTNLQGTQARGGSFKGTLVTARYAPIPKPPGSAVGLSILTGTQGALEATCTALSVSFVGKPEAGKTWQLDYPTAFGTGDGGTIDAGVLAGRGRVDYTEGCYPDGITWGSSSGTFTIDEVRDPTVAGATATPGAIKTVTFTIVGAQLGPSSTTATGTMTLDGSGTVQLFQGMNQ